MTVRWRWHNERIAKLVIGFAIDMNPFIESIERLNALISEYLERTYEQGIFQDIKTVNTHKFGMFGIRFHIINQSEDKFPFTLIPSLDFTVLFAMPMKHDCRANEAYMADPKRDSHRAFMKKYLETDLQAAEWPWFCL